MGFIIKSHFAQQFRHSHRCAMLPRAVFLTTALRRLVFSTSFATCASASKAAIVDKHGEHSFAQLAGRTATLAGALHLNNADHDLLPPRVALLCGRDVSYVVALLSVWRAGLCAVPLGLGYPPKELEYFLRQSRAQLLLYSREFEATARHLNRELPDVAMRPLAEEDFLADRSMSDAAELLPLSKEPHRAAMIIYTSGTTGRPKGVVITRRNLQARLAAMRQAWAWSADDVLLNCLPLHHVHGIENCLLMPLAAGATCLLLPPDRFSPEGVWDQLIGSRGRANLFMAVPTIYAKLIAFHKERQAEKSAAEVRRLCEERFRLMVSGSAALPDPVLHEWYDITGHTLLERYGMTELGMALSNPLHGDRLPGHVGRPLPGVEARISDGGGAVVVEACMHDVRSLAPEMTPGDLLVRGPAVFDGYFDNEAATHDAFTPDGWFRTGDTALYDPQLNAFRLLGRSSVDILKSGGYKVSALEIERKLLAHPDLAAVTVVGLNDATWGQRVVAAVVTTPGVAQLDVAGVREWCKAQMAPQEVPTEIRVLTELPVNAMGKVNKKELMRLLEEK